jgi:hypothetical protein
MQGILYEEGSVIPFIILNLLIGGWASWQTGRATAQTWRPILAMVPYAFLLGAAVRFLHFAVFGGHLLSLQFYIVDSLVVLLLMLIGFRWKRSEQMATQYSWLFERRNLLGWAEKRSS